MYLQAHKNHVGFVSVYIIFVSVISQKTMKKTIALYLLVSTALSGMASSQQDVDTFIADPALIPASVGICITNVTTGETVATYNERQAIIPASTVKIITTATALQLLGPSYRTYTTVDYTGTIDEAGRLQGDIVIRGGGDPSLGSAYGSRSTDAFIDQVVSSIKSNHIQSIEGNIIIDNSLFDGHAVSPKWMVEDIIWDYGTGCHAFSYKDNRVDIDLLYNGKSYDITGIQPANRFSVDADLTKGEEEDITVSHNGNRYTITGTIPKRKNRCRLSLSIEHPDSLFIQELSERLLLSGIKIERGTHPGNNLARETTLLRYPSDSLAYLIRSLNVRSDNLYAESLLRHIALSAGEGGSTKNGISRIRQYWQSCGADSLELFLYDGSGLARNNKISARYLARVLEKTAQDPSVAETFVSSLPIAGKEGSVASFMRNAKLPGELRLKSGSMSDVHAYAGYYTTSKNRYAIVVLVNNYTCNRTQLKYKIAALLTRILSKKE